MLLTDKFRRLSIDVDIAMPMALKPLVLTPPLDKLNILQRGGNAEAFHYWNQAHTYLSNP